MDWEKTYHEERDRHVLTMSKLTQSESDRTALKTKLTQAQEANKVLRDALRIIPISSLHMVEQIARTACVRADGIQEGGA